MKHTHIYITAVVCFLSISWTGPTISGIGGPDRKIERAKARAERSYGTLSYAQSIKRYKKVLTLKPSDSEAILRIADSYRRINDVEKAVEWYKKAAEAGLLTEKEDQLNYAQVLSSAGLYDEADKWYAYHGEEGRMAELIRNRRMAIENIDSYYQDSSAYYVNLSSFNSEQSDFGPTYTKNGVVFASARPSKGLFKPKYSWDNTNFLDMFELDEKGKAVKIKRGINTRYHEGPAVFFENDQKVIFTRNNYHKGKSSESEDGVNKLKLFFAEKSKNGKKWCPPVELPFNSDNYSVGHPSISEDGKVLYFASDMPGGEGGSDIYKSVWDGNKWGNPENLGDNVNTPGNEFFPFIHNDETLFYSSEGMPGLGGLDVFTVSIEKNEIPKNIGYPINTNKDDFGIIMSPDGRSGYLSSNRDNGVGHDDIYGFERYFYDVRVKLIDAETKLPLEGNIVSKLDANGETIESTDAGTDIGFRVLRGPLIALSGSKEGYEPINRKLVTLNLPKFVDEEYVIELPLTPQPKEELYENIIVVENNGVNTQVFRQNDNLTLYDGSFEGLKDELLEINVNVGSVYMVKNIYYDFDKFNIRSDASKELDKVISVLNKFDELKIDLSAHTDIRGTNRYNDRLAKNRVIAAKTYLIDNGISEERILTNSFGENKLHVDCSNQCEEVMHQSNRRTEIKLLMR